MDVYHAMNRGTEKRTIFLDAQDYARFVHNLYEFNDTERALNVGRTYNSATKNDVRRHSYDQRRGDRLVKVHAWCLMRNHYHLLLSDYVEGGIWKFLKKVNGGYAKYFNVKYQRSGTLFQSKTKKILIEHDGHFMHILNYIHLNPLDYLPGTKEWRRSRIKNSIEALAHLDEYRWSSYRDYCGVRNFPSIITTELFGKVGYRKNLLKYLQSIETKEYTHLSLE